MQVFKESAQPHFQLVQARIHAMGVRVWDEFQYFVNIVKLPFRVITLLFLIALTQLFMNSRSVRPAATTAAAPIIGGTYSADSEAAQG